MDKIWKLALASFLILIGIIYSWPTDIAFALSIGSFYVVFLLGILFEYKKYHNKNVYLAISTFILVLGLISIYIYEFKLNYIQDANKLISFMPALVIAGGTFGIAFARTNSWKKTKMEMKT